MTAPAPQRLSNIQSLRGLAALFVVFTHLPSMELKHGGDVLLPAFTRFGISGVDLFFVISGFIMVYVTWTTERNPASSLKFLFARLTRIYPIYWLIALTVLVVWIARPSLISYDPEQTSLIKSFLLWPQTQFPMLKVAWTLIHEVYFYLVFACLLLLPRKFLMMGLCAWMLFVVGGHQAGLSSISPEMALILHPLTTEFFMGAVAGWAFIRFRALMSWAVLALGLVLWCTALFYLTTGFADTFYPSPWQRVLYFGLPGMFLVYGLAAIERQGTALPRWSATFGDWSYSLYLSHILTLSVVGYLWRPFARSGPFDNILALCFMTAACIAVSAALWYLFEKPVLSFFRAVRRSLFRSGSEERPEQ